MTDKMQIRICWVAIIISMLFLVIGVDYFPVGVLGATTHHPETDIHLPRIP